MDATMLEPKFALGKLFITPAAVERLNPKDVFGAIFRHSQADWGEVDEEDWAQNDLSLREGFRLLSAYRSQEGGEKFWVITEYDRQ